MWQKQICKGRGQILRGQDYIKRESETRGMEEYNFDIVEELKKLPARPGVYLMHDEKDQIIYVGKAISLKNRVRQYFQSSRNKGIKIEQMVTHIRRFEYIVTDSELEALVLECNLIKEHRPKYNTMLMDDKAYPFIKVTVNEPFPRVMLARNVVKDKAKYFGPYTSGQAVRDTIELLHKLYHLRSCNRNLPKDTGKERACLNYHIRQCDAPCQGCISQEEYAKAVSEVVRFLNGHYEGILSELEGKMSNVNNYCIAVKERGDDIVFLRKIIKGGADRSYGIQVAKLAGVPDMVIDRAKEIVEQLTDNDIIEKIQSITVDVKDTKTKKQPKIDEIELSQMSLFDTVKDEDVLKELMEVEVNMLAPIDALNVLYRLQNKLKNRWRG